MKKIQLLIKNIYFFFEFIIALALIKKEAKQEKYKKKVLITPLRGLDNTWIDYLLAIKFSKSYNITVVMMHPSTLPFNEAEKYGKISTKLMLRWYEMKFFLLIILLKIKGVYIIVINKKKFFNNLKEIDIDDINIIENTKDEFLRRYFGDRNYKENDLYLKIKKDVNNVFENMYSLLNNQIKDIDLLWTSHAIYEWGLAYRLASKYKKCIAVWGRNIYNTHLISTSDGPLQIKKPKGYLYKKYKLDLNRRLNGQEIDQPTIFDKGLDGRLDEFFEKNKNIVLLTPNCIWDGDISDRDTIFDDLYDWVQYTLDLSKINNDFAVIVRFHPAEATLWKNRPGLWKMFEENILSDNQLLIPPESKISTIELAKKSNKVIFYSGILSLECLHLNITPYCVSNSFYKHVNGIYKIKTKNEYNDLLKFDSVKNLENLGDISYNDLFCYGLEIIGKNKDLRSNPKFGAYSKQTEIEKYFLELLKNDK